MKPVIKIILAALSGGLFVLCFPTAGFAWMAPVPVILMLLVCYDSRPRASFVYGWITGSVFFTGLCSWVGIYGVVPLAIMGIVMGLSFAAAFAGTTIAVRGLDWWGRILAAPAVWVAVEILRSETGAYSFPYGVAGYAFHGFGPALGLASAVGVYGVSFAVIAFSAAALEAGLAFRSNHKRSAAITAGAVIAAAIIAVAAGGTLNLRLGDESGPSARVALVQASIPQDQKWLSSKSDEIMNKYEKLTLKAGQALPDLIILPEAALPAYVGKNDELAVRLRSWALRSRVPVLAGVPLLAGGGAYNTAALIDKSGRQIGSYAKITPVLFGEIIPFRRFSEMVYPDFNQMGDITTGTDQTVLKVPGRNGFSFGTLICSESMYSRLALGLAAADPDVIIVVTNDGWFYSSNEAELHFGMTKFRAAETGKYIAQAANTGISAVISPSGRVDGEIGLNETGVSEAVVRSRPGGTPFTAGGWLFTYLFIGIIAVAALARGLVNVCTKPQDASII